MTLPLVTGTGVAAAAIPAAATSPSQKATPPHAVVKHQRMAITGFNEDIAGQHGIQFVRDGAFDVVSEPDGTTRRLPRLDPTSTASPAAVSPQDAVVYGDCGDSYMFVDDYGSGEALIATGFDIWSGLPGAVYYNWGYYWENEDTRAYDAWGGSGGLWLRHSWGTSQFWYTDAGYVFAEAQGYAYLSDGSRCDSFGPSDYTYVSP